MAIAVNGTPVTNVGSGSVVLAITANTGDLVVAVGGCQQTSASTWSGPDGTWTQDAALFSNSTADTNLVVYHKVMTATPDTTVTLDGSAGTSRHAGLLIVLTAEDTSTPLDVAVTTATSTGNTPPNCPSITTVTDLAWVLAIAGSSQPDVVTAPAGYSNLTQRANTDIQVILSTKEVTPAGAEDPAAYGNWTGGATDSQAMITLAVRPAAGGGITGVAAITEDDDTVAGTGTLAIAGVAAITEASDTLAGTGTVTQPAILGVAAITEQGDTLAATGMNPNVQPSVVYSGDGWGYDARSRRRLSLSQLLAARDKERAQLAKDLRTAVKAIREVPKAKAALKPLVHAASALLESPGLPLDPLLATLQDVQKALWQVQARAAAKAALEAEQRATLIAAYNQLLADMAAEDDDEEAIMMILAQVV